MVPQLSAPVARRTWVRLAPALVTAMVAALAATTAQAQTTWPKTGFEIQNGSRWTYLSEEKTFLEKLDEATARVTVRQTGVSAGGRPLRLVIVGPTADTATIAAGSSILLLGSQHGDEPAGREAAMQKVRDHAASGSPGTLLAVVTANPDGIASGREGNATGVNLNRDWVRLATPEVRAMMQTITSYRPDLIGDLHEYTSGYWKYPDSNDYIMELFSLATDAPDVNADVIRLSGLARTDCAQPLMTAAGFTVKRYTTSGTVRETAMNTAGRMNIPAYGTETPRDGTQSTWNRVRATKLAIDGGIKMVRERGPELAVATVPRGRLGRAA